MRKKGPIEKIKKVTQIRLLPEMRDRLELLSKKQGSDFSKVSRELYDMYIDYYEFLEAQAIRSKLTVVGVMKEIIAKYISR